MEQKNVIKHVELRKNSKRPGRRVFTINDEPSMTDQSFTKEVDVNNIMAAYIKTGQVTHLAKTVGVYADVSEIGDLHESLQQVELAQYAFDNLPSDLRLRFNNSPIEMINFLQDEKNQDEAVKLGLVPKKYQAPTPTPDLTSNKKTKTAPKSNDDPNDDSNPQ